MADEARGFDIGGREFQGTPERGQRFLDPSGGQQRSTHAEVRGREVGEVPRDLPVLRNGARRVPALPEARTFEQRGKLPGEVATAASKRSRSAPSCASGAGSSPGIR